MSVFDNHLNSPIDVCCKPQILRISKAFPAIIDAGGYEILRSDGGGNSKSLIEVPQCSSRGNSVEFLKSTLGQAKAYLRPLQKDIPLGVQQNNAKVILLKLLSLHVKG